MTGAAERPLVCRACREAMPDIGWNAPCPHWKETPEYVAALEAQLRDSEARNATSLEVIRAREEQVERQRVEIERLRSGEAAVAQQLFLTERRMETCCRLLLEAIQDPERVTGPDGTRCWEIVVKDEWMVAARAVGGEDE